LVGLNLGELVEGFEADSEQRSRRFDRSRIAQSTDAFRRSPETVS
jgi:hypothetical protein